MSHSTRPRIDILATQDTSASTLFGLFDVLSTVGVGWENFVSGESSNAFFDVRIVAATRRPLQCGNALVEPHRGFDDPDPGDIVLVASFAVPGLVLRKHEASEFQWLRRMRDAGATIGAVCTASSILAEAELLDGFEATTYWAYRELVARHYPGVRWQIEKNLCVADGDSLITSGGGTAWQEMALYLITRYCGVEAASQAAKFWVIPDRGIRQSPYAAMQHAVTCEDEAIRAAQVWLADNYRRENPINGVVDYTGMPPTTFARRFKRATGERPIDFVHRIRIEKAKSLLESDSMNVADIAAEVGYEDPTAFRRLFKRSLGITPGVYRQRFGHSRFARYIG